MGYLLTIADDEGNVITQTSVEELTEDQVAGVFACFTERDNDDESGPARIEGDLELEPTTKTCSACGHAEDDHAREDGEVVCLAEEDCPCTGTVPLRRWAS